MKHLGPGHVDLLDRLLREAGIGLDADAQQLLVAYLDRVIEVNLSLNLTRIVSPEDAIRLHLVDSLLALPDVVGAPAGRLLDIGTGGGFPGVALCIAGRRPGILLDSVGKKARAVNSILDELALGLDVRALPERAEEHALRHCEGYSVVTARAVSELPALIELASPLLAESGRLVALKGSPENAELERGRSVAALVGMREVSITTTELPGGGERRCLVVYERSGSPRVRLPRRPGAAQNTPLA